MSRIVNSEGISIEIEQDEDAMWCLVVRRPWMEPLRITLSRGQWKQLHTMSDISATAAERKRETEGEQFRRGLQLSTIETPLPKPRPVPNDGGYILGPVGHTAAQLEEIWRKS